MNDKGQTGTTKEVKTMDKLKRYLIGESLFTRFKYRTIGEIIEGKSRKRKKKNRR